jgi:hypothetical protein
MVGWILTISLFKVVHQLSPLHILDQTVWYLQWEVDQLLLPKPLAVGQTQLLYLEVPAEEDLEDEEGLPEEDLQEEEDVK